MTSLSTFVSQFYADVDSPDNGAAYSAHYLPDGVVNLRGEFKGTASIKDWHASNFSTRFDRWAHTPQHIYQAESNPDMVFITGIVDIDVKNGPQMREVPFTARMTFGEGRKIKEYIVLGPIA